MGKLGGFVNFAMKYTQNLSGWSLTLTLLQGKHRIA